MLMGSRRRNLFVILFVIGMTIASVYIVATRDTKLGLDLAGGTRLVYQGQPTPQVPEVTPEDVDQSVEIIRERVDKLGVAEPEIARVGTDQVQVDLPDVQDTDRAIAQVGDTAQLFLYDWQPNVIAPDGVAVEDADDQPIPQLFDAVKLASEQEAACEGCTTAGSRFWLFDKDTKQVVAGPSKSEEDLFQGPDAEALPPDQRRIFEVPQGTIVVESEPNFGDSGDDADDPTRAAQYFVLMDQPSLSGTDLENPEQNFDAANQPVVTFDFTGEGRVKFQEVTREISLRGRTEAPVGLTNSADADQFSNNFAIALDRGGSFADTVIESRPIINFIDNPDGIDGRTGAQIAGNFDIQEAQDLATVLQIGALPIELELVSQSTVSATLGAEALNQGLTAGLIGLAIVILFLIAYYRFLGIVAALGILVYAVFFFALIKLIPITLTLPGIAGLILTIGVAADSNIVIFERIKEEARAGRSMTSAIATGYRKGIGTIIDANVITLLTAFILFVLATAGVKGFAFALGVGTLVSLFTAVVFTQAVLGALGRAKFLRSPKFLGAGEQKVSWRFNWTGMSKWFFSISGAILAIGAISFATNQLNFGIDFESGTQIKASLEEPATVEEVRDSLSAAGAPNPAGAKIQETEEEDFGQNVVEISTQELAPDGVGAVQTQLSEDFGLVGGDDGFESNSVGPTFGEQIARSAVLAIIFSLILISAYMAFRFEAKYAVPVMIAVIHDILITAGVYSLADREVTAATVAAFLTILGYSLYDTVIVFDRIRENVPRLPRAAFSQIVNRSMSEILTRSLITGLSTVFLLAVILVFGGETLQDFAFAMMIGVLSGTYSSIFIASPVLTAWKAREHGYRLRRARIEEAMGYVPAYPEDNVVAKLGDEGDDGVPALEDGDRGPAPVSALAEPQILDSEEGEALLTEQSDAELEPEAPAPSRADVSAAPTTNGEPDSTEPEPVGTASKQDGERQQRKRRQNRRRRKHGRHR